MPIVAWENYPRQLNCGFVGFWPYKSPISKAKSLIDGVCYVWSDSVKCEQCVSYTSGDELTLFPTVALNYD